MKIEIFTEGEISFPWEGMTKRRVRATASGIAKALDVKGGSLTIILTDNEYIRAINRKYRKKNRPTDVISFSYRDDPFPCGSTGGEFLGDVYLSLERAREQAADNGGSFEDEVKRLLIHGILHLLGFNHERSLKEAKVMKEKEALVWDSLRAGRITKKTAGKRTRP